MIRKVGFGLMLSQALSALSTPYMCFFKNSKAEKIILYLFTHNFSVHLLCLPKLIINTKIFFPFTKIQIE